MSDGAGDVWLVDHAPIQGGGQRFGQRLVEAYREAGRKAEMVEDLRLPRIVFPNPAVLLGVRRTRRFLAGLDPSAIVIGNHPRAHAFLYAARPRSGGPAIVFVAHERETAQRRGAPLAYRRWGGLVAIGANAAREYESRLPRAEVTKINNFLPVEYFERARGREALTSEAGDLSIGVLARLVPEKGVAELVAELGDPAVRPAWRELVIAGGRQDVSYASRVERRIDELDLSGRVRLVGEVQDVPRLLSTVDVLVVPSVGKEAQPTAIIEALAQGVPVIVRDPLYSPDFEGLPVASYETAGELGNVLRGPRPAPSPVDELIRRFGPAQAIAGIDAAAQLAKARS